MALPYQYSNVTNNPRYKKLSYPERVEMAQKYFHSQESGKGRYDSLPDAKKYELMKRFSDDKVKASSGEVFSNLPTIAMKQLKAGGLALAASSADALKHLANITYIKSDSLERGADRINRAREEADMEAAAQHFEAGPVGNVAQSLASIAPSVGTFMVPAMGGMKAAQLVGKGIRGLTGVKKAASAVPPSAISRFMSATGRDVPAFAAGSAALSPRGERAEAALHGPMLAPLFAAARFVPPKIPLGREAATGAAFAAPSIGAGQFNEDTVAQFLAGGILGHMGKRSENRAMKKHQAEQQAEALKILEKERSERAREMWEVYQKGREDTARLYQSYFDKMNERPPAGEVLTEQAPPTTSGVVPMRPRGAGGRFEVPYTPLPRGLEAERDAPVFAEAYRRSTQEQAERSAAERAENARLLESYNRMQRRPDDYPLVGDILGRGVERGAPPKKILPLEEQQRIDVENRIAGLSAKDILGSVPHVTSRRRAEEVVPAETTTPLVLRHGTGPAKHAAKKAQKDLVEQQTKQADTTAPQHLAVQHVPLKSGYENWKPGEPIPKDRLEDARVALSNLRHSLRQTEYDIELIESLGKAKGPRNDVLEGLRDYRNQLDAWITDIIDTHGGRWTQEGWDRSMDSKLGNGDPYVNKLSDRAFHEHVRRVEEIRDGFDKLSDKEQRNKSPEFEASMFMIAPRLGQPLNNIIIEPLLGKMTKKELDFLVDQAMHRLEQAKAKESELAGATMQATEIAREKTGLKNPQADMIRAEEALLREKWTKEDAEKQKASWTGKGQGHKVSSSEEGKIKWIARRDQAKTAGRSEEEFRAKEERRKQIKREADQGLGESRDLIPLEQNLKDVYGKVQHAKRNEATLQEIKTKAKEQKRIDKEQGQKTEGWILGSSPLKGWSAKVRDLYNIKMANIRMVRSKRGGRAFIKKGESGYVGEEFANRWQIKLTRLDNGRFEISIDKAPKGMEAEAGKKYEVASELLAKVAIGHKLHKWGYIFNPSGRIVEMPKPGSIRSKDHGASTNRKGEAQVARKVTDKETKEEEAARKAYESDLVSDVTLEGTGLVDAKPYEIPSRRPTEVPITPLAEVAPATPAKPTTPAKAAPPKKTKKPVKETTTFTSDNIESTSRNTKKQISYNKNINKKTPIHEYKIGIKGEGSSRSVYITRTNFGTDSKPRWVWHTVGKKNKEGSSPPTTNASSKNALINIINDRYLESRNKKKTAEPTDTATNKGMTASIQHELNRFSYDLKKSGVALGKLPTTPEGKPLPWKDYTRVEQETMKTMLAQLKGKASSAKVKVVEDHVGGKNKDIPTQVALLEFSGYHTHTPPPSSKPSKKPMLPEVFLELIEQGGKKLLKISDKILTTLEQGLVSDAAVKGLGRYSRSPFGGGGRSGGFIYYGGIVKAGLSGMRAVHTWANSFFKWFTRLLGPDLVKESVVVKKVGPKVTRVVKTTLEAPANALDRAYEYFPEIKERNLGGGLLKGFKKWLKKHVDLEDAPAAISYKSNKPAPKEVLEKFHRIITNAKVAREQHTGKVSVERGKLGETLDEFSKGLKDSMSEAEITKAYKELSSEFSKASTDADNVKITFGKGELLTPKEISQLMDHIKSHQAFEGPFNAYNRARAIFDFLKLTHNISTSKSLKATERTGVIPSESGIFALGDVLGYGAVKGMLSKLPKGFNRDMMFGALSSFKTLKSAFDLSASLRQGWALGVTNPRLWTESMKMQFLALKDPVAALKVHQEAFHGEGSKTFSKAGLNLAKMSGFLRGSTTKDRIKLGEETMLGSRVLGRAADIKGKTKLGKALAVFPNLFGKGIRASERTYITFLNSQMMKTFSLINGHLREYATKNQKSPEWILSQQKVLSKMINAATGRSNLTTMELGKLANTLMFSPRFWVSRFEYPFRLLQYSLGSKASGPIRRYAMRQLISNIGTYALIGSMVGVLADQLGLSWGKDPRSSNFLKVTLPDNKTKLDFSAGFGKTIRLGARTMPGFMSMFPGFDHLEAVSIDSGGNRRAIKGRQGYWNEFSKTVMSSIAPAPSAALMMFSQEKYGGEKADIADLAVTLALPISAETFADEMDNWGQAGSYIKAGSLTGLDAFGIGVGSYNPQKSSGPQRLTSSQRKRKSRRVKKNTRRRSRPALSVP